MFERLDFEIAAGRCLVLTGANGSGKTSLLRVMAGLTPMSAGEIAWDGASVAEDPEAHGGRLQFLGHSDAIKPALTASENIIAWIRLRGGEDVDTKAREALERLDLGHLADIPARLLSAGQRRRLALCRVVAIPAPLWLLDEPTVALDQSSVAQFLDLIADHLGSGGRAAISTHIPLALPAVDTLDVSRFAAAADDYL